MSEKEKAQNKVRAFPLATNIADHVQLGLTKREWFAGLAMQGLVAHQPTGFDKYIAAKEAVAYADALLARLAEKGEG